MSGALSGFRVVILGVNVPAMLVGARLASFGGHGYGHIFRNVVPMMKKRGYSEDEIDAILVLNPRRLLTFV